MRINQRLQEDNNAQVKFVDIDGYILAYISKHGFIYDHEHTLLGYVSLQGIVRDLGLHNCGQVNLHDYAFPFTAGSVAFFLLSPTEPDHET